MKKLMTVLGIVFFASVLALPVYARGPGMGRGYGMMGSRGPGSAYCDQGGGFYRERNQGPGGGFIQGTDAQFAPNDRFGRGYPRGGHYYERGAGGYGNYGQMGGFGMGRR